MKQIFLLFFSALALNANAQLPSYVPSDSLKCYYMFDDNTNYGKDYSINHNDLSNSAAGHDTDRNGLPDGAEKIGEIESSYKGVIGNQQRTISCWINSDYNLYDTIQQTLPYYKSKYLFGYSDFRVYLNGDVIIFYSGKNEVAALLPGLQDYPHINAHEWHLITVTFNGSRAADINMYIDGVLSQNYVIQGNNLEVIGSVEENITAGSTNNDTSLNFKGKIDEFAFWSKALTVAEIAKLYTGDVSHVANAKVVDFSIAPNPVNSILNIRSSATIGQIELFDLTGKLVLSQMTNGNRCSLDISMLKAGTYILRANGSFIDKVIKN